MFILISLNRSNVTLIIPINVSLHLSLFLTAAVARQSHWSNPGRGLKTIRSTALRDHILRMLDNRVLWRIPAHRSEDLTGEWRMLRE
jgi:hypothetical protein